MNYYTIIDRRGVIKQNCLIKNYIDEISRVDSMVALIIKQEGIMFGKYKNIKFSVEFK